MLWSSVYDDKWLTSTMIIMNPSQRNLPHQKFTDGISMACSYPGPWDTFLTLFENFLVGEYWRVAHMWCKNKSSCEMFEEDPLNLFMLKSSFYSYACMT